MSRLNHIVSQPRKLLIAMATVTAAVGVAIGSGANFTSDSANAANSMTAGVLKHSNSRADQAILAVDKMKPGESRSGTVDIKNTGDIDGAFSLSKSNLADTPAGTATPLSAKLDLKVDDCGTPVADPNACASPVQKYSGKLDGLGNVALGSFAASDARRYRFTVTFPDGGTGADNAYMGHNSTVTFNWRAVSS